MKKFWFIFLAKKGCTTPLVKISFFKKILVRWISSILCSHVAFSSIVLFDMFLWSNDFKRFVVSKYGKYYVAYFVWDSSHCYKLWFWFTFLQVVIAEYGIFSLSVLFCRFLLDLDLDYWSIISKKDRDFLKLHFLFLWFYQWQQ